MSAYRSGRGCPFENRVGTCRDASLPLKTSLGPETVSLARYCFQRVLRDAPRPGAGEVVAEVRVVVESATRRARESGPSGSDLALPTWVTSVHEARTNNTTISTDVFA